MPAKPLGRNVLVPALSFHRLALYSERPNSTVPFHSVKLSVQPKRRNRKSGIEREGVDPLTREQAETVLQAKMSCRA